MDIRQILVDDLQAARECLAEAGNTPQASAAARTDALARFSAILDADRRALEQAVLPALRRAGRLTPGVQDAYAALARAQEEGASLAAGDAHDDQWFRRFAALAAGYEGTAAKQTGALLPELRALDPHDVAALTRAAAEFRLGRLSAGRSAPA
jgi:hypothetical protein